MWKNRTNRPGGPRQPDYPLPLIPGKLLFPQTRVYAWSSSDDAPPPPLSASLWRRAAALRRFRLARSSSARRSFRVTWVADGFSPEFVGGFCDISPVIAPLLMPVCVASVASSYSAVTLSAAWLSGLLAVKPCGSVRPPEPGALPARQMACVNLPFVGPHRRYAESAAVAQW